MQELKDKFEAFKTRVQPVSDDALPLAEGHFGLVIAQDDVVTKALYRSHWRESAEKNLEREVEFLQVFRDHNPKNLALPSLVKEPIRFSDDHFMAAYSMTRLDGQAGDPWGENLSKEKLTKQFYEAGKTLARFHKFTTEALRQKYPHRTQFATQDDYRWCEAIYEIPSLGRKVNAALEKADAYFQENKKFSVVHGDYHAGNLLFDQKGNVSGVTDFSFWSYGSNHLRDFLCVPDPYFPDFTKGYEEAGGEKFDPMMMTMTELSVWSIEANRGTDDPQIQQENLKRLERHLINSAPVTGYAP
jgi:hypothetical protein